MELDKGKLVIITCEYKKVISTMAFDSWEKADEAMTQFRNKYPEFSRLDFCEVELNKVNFGDELRDYVENLKKDFPE